MRKNKHKKYTTNILDIITLQNLKWIIVVCFILSILCEFLPSIFDICKLFKYNWFVVFLQPHKDFFTNITLGCLGSAIISYIMLLIPSKVKEQEEKDKISMHLKQVISDFFILHSILYCITDSKSLEDSESLENSIKIEKTNLRLHINNLLDYYKKTSYINNKEIKEIIDICQNKLLLAMKEMDIFLEIYASLRNVDNDVSYPIGIVNKIYKILYDSLNESYDLMDVRDKFSNIMPPEIAAMRDVKEIGDSMLNYIDAKKTAKIHIYYAEEICSVYRKYTEESFNKLKK